MYHHNATALFADIVNVVDLNKTAAGTFGHNATVFRLHYFMSSWPLLNLFTSQYRYRPVPGPLLDTVPCLVDTTVGDDVAVVGKKSFLLRSAVVDSGVPSNCIYTIPGQPLFITLSQTASCQTTARPAAAGMCEVNLPVVMSDGLGIAARLCGAGNHYLSWSRTLHLVCCRSRTAFGRLDLLLFGFRRQRHRRF